MLDSQWLLWLVLGLTAAHTLVVYLAYRRRDDQSEYVGADSVACPDCGTENDPGYRYCRACVAELPGETAVQHRPASAAGRRIP